MARQRVKFTFPKELVTEAVIHKLGKNFEVVTNIRRADVRDDMGWVILELEGPTLDIENGVQWVASQGVRVDLIDGDIIEG